LFDHFGGHFASGGFSVTEEKVHELSSRLNSAYVHAEHTEDATKEVVVDRQSELAELSFALKSLDRLAPFGVGNERPLFLFSKYRDTKYTHVWQSKTIISSSRLSKMGARAGSIAFFATPLSFQKQFVVGDRVDVVGHIERDWRGQPRIRIVDII